MIFDEKNALKQGVNVSRKSDETGSETAEREFSEGTIVIAFEIEKILLKI